MVLVDGEQEPEGTGPHRRDTGGGHGSEPPGQTYNGTSGQHDEADSGKSCEIPPSGRRLSGRQEAAVTASPPFHPSHQRFIARAESVRIPLLPLPT
mmetsp:Transcript_27544/g.55122  ORF Transcript_27544/g.55122 Transcript_27544/m.55122 type:complete len:96 (-) Transcript_27544:301-588(-)